MFTLTSVNSLCLNLLGLKLLAIDSWFALPRLQIPALLVCCFRSTNALFCSLDVCRCSTESLLDRKFRITEFLFLRTTCWAWCESGSSKMLLTLDKAFLGLSFNNSKRWEDRVVIGKFPPESCDSLRRTPLFVGGGFSNNRCLASFNRKIASLFSIID
jgi:hypothetical protein